MPAEVYFAPRNGWLALLADGWRLPWIVEPMRCHHGEFAVVLERGEV